MFDLFALGAPQCQNLIAGVEKGESPREPWVAYLPNADGNGTNLYVMLFLCKGAYQDSGTFGAGWYLSWVTATSSGPAADLVGPWSVPQKILSGSELTQGSPSDWNVVMVTPDSGHYQGVGPTPTIGTSGVLVYSHTDNYANIPAEGGAHEPFAISYTLTFQ